MGNFGVKSPVPLLKTLPLASVSFYLHIYKEIANTLKCKSNSLGFGSLKCISKFKIVLGNSEG